MNDNYNEMKMKVIVRAMKKVAIKVAVVRMMKNVWKIINKSIFNAFADQKKSNQFSF